MILIRVTYRDKLRVWEIDAPRIIVGRVYGPAKVVDVDLSPDRRASRIHARITRESDDIFIEDLNSTSGTLVSGDQIRGQGKRRLQRDDVITIGESKLIVTVQPGHASETPH
jgi:pSer/pThr/pTyr-binding forkhead associated (FHA) protein